MRPEKHRLSSNARRCSRNPSRQYKGIAEEDQTIDVFRERQLQRTSLPHQRPETTDAQRVVTLSSYTIRYGIIDSF
jgi:hypothetical protein